MAATGRQRRSVDPDRLGSNPCSSPVSPRVGDLFLQAASVFPAHHRRSVCVPQSAAEGLI